MDKAIMTLLAIFAIVILLVCSYAVFTDYKIPVGKKYNNTVNISKNWSAENITHEVKLPVLMEYNHTQYWVKDYQVISKCSMGWKIINGYNKTREDVLNSLPSYYKTRC